jgi:hypothetical protein
MSKVKIYQCIGINREQVVLPNVIDIYFMVGCFYVPCGEGKAFRFNPENQLEDQESGFNLHGVDRSYTCDQVFVHLDRLKNTGVFVATMVKTSVSEDDPNGRGFKLVGELDLKFIRKLKKCFPQELILPEA